MGTTWKATWSILCFILQVSSALHHNFYTKHDHRNLVGPVGVPFGFLTRGQYDLSVYDFELALDKKKYKPLEGQESWTEPELYKALEPGFLLKRFDNEAAFNQFMDELRSDPSKCAFEEFLEDDHSYLNSVGGFDENVDAVVEGELNAEHGVFLSLKNWPAGMSLGPERAVASTSYTFQDNEEGLYFLIYQICPSLDNGSKMVPNGIVSTYELDYHLINFDSSQRMNYLTAGEMNLPLAFFYFAVSYGFCCGWWINNIRKIQSGIFTGNTKPTIYAIHHLMSALIVIKTVTVLLESIRYHYLKVVGHAEMWSFVYYTFAFLKGTFLFVVILLIGSGWSIVKPFMNSSEKKVILAILILQIINNIALTVLAHETEGESAFDGWTAILHLVDIICCCAVLLPIVWQVNQLEKSVIVEDPDHPDFNGEDAEEDGPGSPDLGNLEDMGEKGRILSKLKLFRTFYMLVVAYVYSTRIIVYLFASMLSYKHLWIRYFVVELVTLTFYVVTGYYFRPTVDVPYKSLKDEEDGDDDNFINESELEMR